MNLGTWVENRSFEVRYALRMIRKAPGTSSIAVMSLALGIGANTAIFSTIDAVLLRPLPFQNPERLVKVLESNPEKGYNRLQLSLADFDEWKGQSKSFDQMAALSFVSLRVTGSEIPESISANRVSVQLFDMLGVKAAAGRTFLPQDEEASSEPVAVLTHGYWVERYAGDADVVGRTITLNGKTHTIVGVLPEDFKETFESHSGYARIWVPIVADSKEMSRHGPGGNMVIARLKSDVTIEQARAEINSVAEQLANMYPKTNAGVGASVFPLHEEVTGPTRPSLLVLIAAAGFVLLIACANVASIMLARGVDRAKEIAIRAAIGARRRRIVQQLLTESLLVSVLGGALGLLLALWALYAIVPMIPPNVPRTSEVTLNARALLFTIVISAATAVISGLLPALQTSKVSLTEALKESGHQSSSGRRSRFLRDWLVVLQVAFTFVLLIGAGLMTNSFARLYNVEPGFNTQNLLTMLVSLPRGEKDAPEKWSAFWTEAIARSQNVPGVLGAAVVNPLPLANTPFGMYVSRADGASTNPDERFQVLYSTISNDYFHLMRIPLRGGRYFHDSDRADSSPVVIVNETFVRLYLSNQEPSGERLIVDRGAKRERSAAIIGVVADSKSRLDEEERPHIYLSVLQSPQPSMYVVTRTATEASGFAVTMRNLILEMDKNQPVGVVRTMKAIRAEYMVRPRFYLTLLASFALVATLLAASGIYGVFSHTLTQRTHEIGIRMALGARTSDVMSMVIVQGMKLTLLGLAAGLIGAFTLTGSIKNWIFGVSATDPLTFITVALVLAGVALGACFVPARRATKVDPMVALRYE